MGSSSSSAVSHKRSASTSISSTRTTPKLSERDARTIALAWRQELCGCVRLETSNTDRLPPSIIPKFEWVVFVFNGSRRKEEGSRHEKDPQKTAAYARAATIAWFALSCCEGYSGTENPQFWRCVFLEFLFPEGLRPISQRDENAKRAQRPLTEAIRFFDGVEKPFPRIKLVVGDVDTTKKTECVFLGKISYKDKALEAKLQRILTMLQPFIRTPLWTRRVPVTADTLTTSAEMGATLLRDTINDPESEPEPPSSVTISTAFPQLQLQSEAVDHHTFSSFESLFTQLPPNNVDAMMGDTRDSQRQRLRCGLVPEPDVEALDARRPRWRVIKLLVERTNHHAYSHLDVKSPYFERAEELPSFRTIHGTPSSISTDWAWLGYMIFHPDAASQSAFTSIKINLRGITAADITALRKMAVGNNLLGGNRSGYFEGLVRPSTPVWACGNDSKATEYKFETSSWISLCVPAASKLKFPDWVCTVIPGFGFSWIRSTDFIKTRSRVPGKSNLRSLCLNFEWTSVPDDMITDLLSLFGGQLTTLQLKRIMLPQSTVQAILRLCPVLKSLRLHHDGSFWADEELVMELPQLEELELTLDNGTGLSVRFQELQPACLPHLKTLRVISGRGEGYRHHKRTLASFLASQPMLQYLHWSSGSDLSGGWVDSRCCGKNESTSAFLQELPAVFHLRYSSYRPECKLAFLSVVRCLDSRSCVGRLAEDVVALIFEYATSTSQREICINP